MNPVQKRKRLNTLLRNFRELHPSDSGRRKVAEEITNLLNENPWLNDQIPYEVSDNVRTLTRGE